MKYRILSTSNDYVFGQGSAQFLQDTPLTVAQAVKTRLWLSVGEWFLDTLEGTPYLGEILGHGNLATYDQAIQERILGTQGVVSIDAYSSSLEDRNLTVQATITTIYGQTNLVQVF